ncbi:nucleotidyltransferase family protein [Geothrix sp. 21YS21S-2]|uniref:nucleotidyltransferase family protein n=1 Tax=Geothrix sp. 21YS21S-2 TaxID=3068893 RepID=UPI0027BA16D3|nr:nucleotidyltransferase family protein [Geothrix sp. 21YS21S-2]
MLPAVILAAGASRRLGRPKQLERYQGESLLRRAVAAAGACGPVVVVTGCRAEEIEGELRGLAVRVVHNPGWEEGMASSIREGVRALGEGAEGALFLVCDQPAVDAVLVGRLLARWRGAPVACAYGGVRGIPAILPARAFPQLLALAGDTGARGLLQGDDVVEVPFPEGAWDVDEPGDL